MMNADRNLQFGALALRLNLIDSERFGEACRLWSARPAGRLGDVCVARGFLSETQRAEVDRLLDAGAGMPVESPADLPADDDLDDEFQRFVDVMEDSEIEDATIDPLEEEPFVAPRADGLDFDRYLPKKLHAQGGLGRVWLARDEALGREVALKELRPERASNPSTCARFVQEARITGQLEHPGIVPVYGLTERVGDRSPFYTMRFVKGRTLDEAIKDYHEKRRTGGASALDFSGLLTAFVAVGNAVAYAHSRGVIHRDLKGQNVILGDFGEVILLDWGLAKYVRYNPTSRDFGETSSLDLGPLDQYPATSTVEGHALGTPAYMPPEQAAGRIELVDERSDVYGLGAMLYEILSGRPPFDHSDTNELLRKVREETPVRPRQLCPGAPRSLEAVCLKALSKDPADRYASASDLTREVRRWLADEPVEAWREPLSSRARRWVSRHRVGMAAAVAAIVVSSITLGVSTALLGSAFASEREAKTVAMRHQEAADQHFRLAFEAIEANVKIVKESDFFKRPESRDVRDRLLRNGLKFFASFASGGDRDSQLQAELAAAYFRSAKIVEDIGSKEEALSAYRKALEIYLRLEAGMPSDPVVLARKAECGAHIGRIQGALGLVSEALETYERALVSARLLCRDYPYVTEHLATAVSLENGVANLLRQSGRNAEALRRYRTAFDRLESMLAGDRPIPAEDRGRLSRLLAGIGHNIGVLSHVSGDLTNALTLLDRSRSIREELLKSSPEDRLLLSDLALGFNEAGLVKKTLGRLDDAFASQSRALEIQQRLVTANPSMTDYRRDLAGTYTHIANLRYAQGRTDLSRAAYENAREIYRAVAAENPKLVLVLGNLATVSHNLAFLDHEAGRLDEALASYQEAIDSLRSLVKAYPSDPRFASQLAAALDGTGELRRDLGSERSSVRDLEEARRIHERLVADYPDISKYREDHSACLIQIGLTQRVLGRDEEAFASFHEAEAQLSDLVESHPNQPSLRHGLAAALLNLAEIDEQSGRTVPAKQQALRAVEYLDALTKLGWENVEYRRDLGKAWARLGSVEAILGDREASKRAFEKAREIAEPLACNRPDSPEYLQGLGEVLREIGASEARQGRDAPGIDRYRESAALYRKALEIAPRSEARRRTFGAILNRLAGLERRNGRVTDAVMTIRERLSLWPGDPAEQFAAAREIAKCVPKFDASAAPWLRSRYESLAKLAVISLRRAAETGYVDLDRLKSDPDLESIRGYAACREWLEEMAALIAKKTA